MSQLFKAVLKNCHVLYPYFLEDWHQHYVLRQRSQ